MRFLSLYGTDGFRTFLGVLNGKLEYTPAKIPNIDPEILTERDHASRLEAIIAPYTENHPSLKNILPIISSNIGTLESISSNCSLWVPKYHLSYLGLLLLAGMREEFLNEDNNPLTFFETPDDDGSAFIQAFSLEKKTIYSLNDKKSSDTLTTYQKYDSTDKAFINKILHNSSFRVDSYNIFRIIGHMATILEAIFKTEQSRQRFYNDPIHLVIPGENMEYVLAAYYLSKSSFPIRSIHVISHQHRMLHQFLQKGEFKITNKQYYEELEFSLDRMLFELARGSAEKVVLWKKELQTKGSFRVDSTAQKGLSIFHSHMMTPSFCQQIKEKLCLEGELSKISILSSHIASQTKELVLGFELTQSN